MLSIANLESIQNNFQYDDSIPFERVTNPPVINKGGLNTNIAKSVLTELPPTTTFSCIVDWVGYVFNIDQSYELTIEEKVADTSEVDNYRRQTEKAAKLNHINNVQDKAQQFHSGPFFIKGETPKPRNGGDWTSKDDVKGRTFYVGSKRNGKEACIYEKGKQLGDTLSQWVRVEVRFTHDDHLVPFDILTSPQMFFAGSYPVLKDTSVFHDRCVV